MDEKINLGDILIFEAENDWISKSIALLTNSNVSHASLVHKDMEMAEMGLSGIQSNSFHIDKNGRKVYILRLNPEKDPAPVIAAAEKYVASGVQYDKPSLYILAGLLIYRVIKKPSKRWKLATDLILRAAIVSLDKLLNKSILKTGAKVMVCSQLAYQCYFDSGRDYQIKIKGGLLQDMAVNNQNSICLANIVEESNFASDSLSADSANQNADHDPQKLAEELYHSLTEEVDSNEMLDTGMLSSTVSLAKKFMDKLDAILKKTGIDVPLPSLFVTPVDLLQNTENLKLQGTVKISRNK